LSRHFAMRVPFPQASPALEADAGTGEEGDRLREGLAARMASGPGLWLEELEGLDRRGLVEQLLAGADREEHPAGCYRRLPVRRAGL